jgi:HlyD family secretion protein
MAKPVSVTAVTCFKGRLPSIKHSGRRVLLAALILLIGAGGLVYSILAGRAAAATEETALQTATVRQGELVLSASGSGVLAPSNEIDLGFTASGQVTAVFVKPGDYVEAGTLLAQVDDLDAQNKYTQTKLAYQELTSAVAVATAQEQAAQAQTDLTSCTYQLEYLISPKVLYWETEIEKGQADLQEAQARLAAAPSDKDTQQAVTKAEAFLDFAQDKLKEAWELYYEEYVPETFPIKEDRNGNDFYVIPTDLEILQARTAIDEARMNLKDSQELVAVLTGGPMPEDASSDALIELQQAELDLQDAQAALGGTKIIAPISGTILTVDASVGNTAGTGTVITMADLSQLALEFYLDESDWDLATVGDPAEITFDDLPDKIFTGKITRLDEKLYQSGNTSVVRGEVQMDSLPDGFELPIGANATVDVIHARVENALLVPLEALHESTPGQYSVFLFENSALTQRAIEIGLQDQFYAEVKSGLKAGDVVSTSAVATQ